MLKSFSSTFRQLHKELCQINGFSSEMIFFIFFIYIPLVHSELHTLITTYTGIHGQTAAVIPEFSAVTTLDGQQIDYYDSVIKKLIPKQDWMRYASRDTWKDDTEIREQVHQIYKNNIPCLMQRFNQTTGVHTYQRMYGCDWNDETNVSHGFDRYRYDEQDFITLDLKNSRYNTSVVQAFATVQKWNKNEQELKFLKSYYDYECIHWLKAFLNFSKAAFNKAGIESELPGQSLTESIQNNLTVDDPKISSSTPDALYIIPTFIFLVIILILLCRNKCKQNPDNKKLSFHKPDHLDENPPTLEDPFQNSALEEGSSLL